MSDSFACSGWVTAEDQTLSAAFRTEIATAATPELQGIIARRPGPVMRRPGRLWARRGHAMARGTGLSRERRTGVGWADSDIEF